MWPKKGFAPLKRVDVYVADVTADDIGTGKNLGGSGGGVFRLGGTAIDLQDDKPV